MTLVDDMPSHFRRVSLALHSLADADRRWMLERLPSEAGPTLERLLAELTELGIPADRAMTQAALEDAVSPGVDAEANEADARMLARHLAQEPSAIQRLVVTAATSPEQGRILSAWPEDLRAVPSVMAEPRWTPALRELVMRSWRQCAMALEARP